MKNILKKLIGCLAVTIALGMMINSAAVVSARNGRGQESAVFSPDSTREPMEMDGTFCKSF